MEKLTLNDISIVRPFFGTGRTSDRSIGSVFMWRDHLKVEYEIYEDSLLVKARLNDFGGMEAFYPPYGGGDMRRGLERIESYCKSRGITLAFFGVEDYMLETLQTQFGAGEVSMDDGWNDYVYFAESLATLAGKKLHGPRNHANYFRKTYPNYTFSEIKPKDTPELLDFFLKLETNKDLTDRYIAEERIKVAEVLENFEKYEFFGEILRIDGKVTAFAIGEKHGDMVFEHIEKADANIRGAYQMICSGFAAKQLEKGAIYINRADDVGDEGLRRSKLSYRPCEILKKYVVRF